MRPEWSHGVGAALAGANPDRLVDGVDKDLAVADPPGMGSLLNRLHGPLDQAVLEDDLHLHLRQEIDHVFSPAIELGMALLASEALGFGDGDPPDADLVEGILHLVQFKGLDNG